MVEDFMAYERPEEYDKRYLQNETERYLHDRWHPCLISKIKSLSDPGTVVVDLGCGTSEFTQHMTGAKLVIGIDASIKMLLYGARKPGARCVCLLQGDATRVPLRADTVDRVFALGLLPYVDMKVALGECRRVLKDGGTLMLVFPNRLNFLNLQGNIIRKIKGTKVERKNYYYHQITRTLEALGFDVLEGRSYAMVTYCPEALQKYVKYLWLLMDKVYGPFQKLFPLGLSVMIIARKAGSMAERIAM